ncbi:MAG: zf-HC2 domain-containing protein [Acidiferrobacterales bacterium]|nr:zf-HC2 domain-containing protein [Acidiferrobacterales bacterium]
MSKNPKELECDEAIRMVLEYLDNELENHDHDALEAHIHKCRACYTRVEFEKRLKGMVQKAPEISAPDSLKSKIKKITDQF